MVRGSAGSKLGRTWRAVALVAAMAAAVCAVVLLGVPQEADARARFETVTRTFESPAAIQIAPSGPANPYPSRLAAGGMRRGKILDVNVKLWSLTHVFPDDVDVMLVGPTGRDAIIMSDAGGGADYDANGISLTLDDEAAAFMPNDGRLVSGTFIPSNYVGNEDSAQVDPFPGAPAPSGARALSTFDGSNPNGTWSLYVWDDFLPDGGQFGGGWDLKIKAKVPR